MAGVFSMLQPGGTCCLVSALRTAVSQKRRRYVDSKHNLDLTYITVVEAVEVAPASASADTSSVSSPPRPSVANRRRSRLVAMGFPAAGVQALFRNSYAEVLAFLNTRHPGRFRIYNLCAEHGYRASPPPSGHARSATLPPHGSAALQPLGRSRAVSSAGAVSAVADADERFRQSCVAYPIRDHNPCSLELALCFCEDVAAFLAESAEHVAVVHCKAGKGRTGLLVCCYKLYSVAAAWALAYAAASSSGRRRRDKAGAPMTQETAAEALDEFGYERTSDGNAVTIPSQKRFVGYFAEVLQRGLLRDRTLAPATLRSVLADAAQPILLHSIAVTGLELPAPSPAPTPNASFSSSASRHGGSSGSAASVGGEDEGGAALAFRVDVQCGFEEGFGGVAGGAGSAGGVVRSFRHGEQVPGRTGPDEYEGRGSGRGVCSAYVVQVGLLVKGEVLVALRRCGDGALVCQAWVHPGLGGMCSESGGRLHIARESLDVRPHMQRYCKETALTIYFSGTEQVSV